MQIDFAEDYKCQTQDEVQSAYWNITHVTIPPGVTYYNTETSITHTNIVYTSDEQSHSFPIIFAILKKLILQIKIIIPHVSFFHYWTDSPSSQYHNKYIFNIILQHESLFDTKALWNYFEVCHGKGPYDELDSTTKRVADNAIKQSSYVIQDAFDFFSWDESSQLSRKILYEFISSEDAALCAEELKSMNPRPTHGAMKLHVVVSSADGINYRNTSCYCVHCFKKGVFTYNCYECKSFSRSQILEFASTVSNSASISSSLIEYTLGYFVAAIYEVEHHVYVGTAVEIDESDNI